MPTGFQLPSGTGNIGSVAPQEYSIPQEYQSQINQAMRQRQIAELLLSQGQQPLPQGDMVSGYYVKPSPLSGIAQILSTIGGVQGITKADAKQREVLQQYQNDTQAEKMKLIGDGTGGSQPDLIAALASNKPEVREMAKAILASRAAMLRGTKDAFTNKALVDMQRTGGNIPPDMNQPSQGQAAIPYSVPDPSAGTATINTAGSLAGGAPASGSPVRQFSGPLMAPVAGSTDSVPGQFDSKTGELKPIPTGDKIADSRFRSQALAEAVIKKNLEEAGKVQGPLQEKINQLPALDSALKILSSKEYNEGKYASNFTTMKQVISKFTGVEPDIKDANSQAIGPMFITALASTLKQFYPLSDTDREVVMGYLATPDKDPRALMAILTNQMRDVTKEHKDYMTKLNATEQLARTNKLGEGLTVPHHIINDYVPTFGKQATKAVSGDRIPAVPKDFPGDTHNNIPDRMKILQQEYQDATDPAIKEARLRELIRLNRQSTAPVKASPPGGPRKVFEYSGGIGQFFGNTFNSATGGNK